MFAYQTKVKIKNKVIVIWFENECYNINADKLLYVIKSLENKPNFKFKSAKQIDELLKFYGLYDKSFLESVDKI